MPRRLGKNEKTKVIAKLQKSGSGPPQREPAVSEEERKAMMAHYFKKQEEMKKLAGETLRGGSTTVLIMMPLRNSNHATRYAPQSLKTMITSPPRGRTPET